jgi:hypothetical protein
MLWVVFTRSESLISKIIRWGTKGSYSHALLLWEDPMLGWMRMEADWDGYHVRPTNLRPRLDGVKVIDRQSIDDLSVVAIPLQDTYDSLLRICAQWLGHRYDYPAIAGFLVVVLGRWLRKRWRNPLSSPSALFCSEAIALGLKQLKYPGFRDVVTENTTPQDLFDLLKQERKAVWCLETTKGA